MESNLNDNMLMLLEQQTENFPVIKNFIKEKRLTPSNIFLAQSLKGISEELTHRGDIVFECFSYLDVVKIYSTVIYSDPETFTDHIINILCQNRTVENANSVINKDAIDDFIFTSKEDMHAFLINNKFLIAIYVFAMINMIFYKTS